MPESDENLRLEIAHVLFIDIVGYSKLLINQQSELLHLLNQIVRSTEPFRAAEETEMLVRLPTGDGMALAFFSSPDAPVHCAMEIDLRLKEYPQLNVRMGIHSGPVDAVQDVNDRSNVAGAGINIAQRVMDCGDAGHILLSKRVADDLAQYERWQPHLYDLGECEVKHGVKLAVVNLYTGEVGRQELPEKFKRSRQEHAALESRSAVLRRRKLVLSSLAFLLLAAAGIGLWIRSRPVLSRTQAASAAGEKSIAVLPFADLSQGKDQEYFCDGISEELLDGLAKIPGLRVVARTSSFSFKGKGAGVAEIGEKLGVATVLEGSLRREGDRIRVTAQLINAKDGFHLWSETFERELQSVFAVQDEITHAIVDALKIKLAIAPAAQPQRNTEAYDLYLRGLYYSNKSTEEGLRKSLEFFQRSLEKDPNSARAWAGIAKVWTWLADAYVRPRDAYPVMKAAALKAVTLDELEPEAHVYLAEAKRVLDWDMAGADRELHRALQLDPNSSTAHCFLALNSAVEGKREEAASHARASVKADPLSPIMCNFASLGYLCIGQIDEAMAEAKRTASLDPNYIYESPVLAAIYLEKGMFQEAIVLFKQAEEVTGGIPQPGLAITYARMNRQPEARAILDVLIKRAATSYIPGEDIAAVYGALGEKDEAFKWLDRACDEHSGPIHAIAVRPVFRPLHSDPRFAAILKRIGLDPTKVLKSDVNGAVMISPKSIAVLPFENLSEEKANAYFADGIQDEILTRLSKIADLKVISRTSTQHYKSAPENLSEIARQLGVAHILEGSVQKSGDTVRVNVQLIKAANDSHLWAETFDRKLTDIFSVETEVAKAIAEQLRVHLTGQEEQVLAARPTDNPEAYDAYLRGLAYTLKTTTTFANALGAQKYLREAVRLDPKFALSWALLSIVDARGYISLSLQRTAALREEARQAAETALTLQPNLGEALHAKGVYYHFCLKDYDTAVHYFAQARQLLPNSSGIPESLAYVARSRGQWDRSETYFNEAERLDPRNVFLLTQRALTYITLRRFPEALRKLEQVLDITPDDLDTLATKAAIAQAEGDLPRASALLAPLRPAADDNQALETQVYQSILERRPGPIISRLKEILAKPDPALGYINGELRFWLGWAQQVAGDHAAAQETWRQARSELEPFLKEQPENQFLIGDLALTTMGLGDKAAAFTLAERAIAVIPIEKDPFDTPETIEILARVAAQMGEPDRAIAALQKLLSIPYDGALPSGMPLTPALLRLDPMFDPMRNHPRFQKLCEDKQP